MKITCSTPTINRVEKRYMYSRLPAIVLVLAVLATACGQDQSQRSVVIYTSVDQHYSEPILRAFEVKFGIRVLPVFDVEAAKTTGLANRLLAEKDRPQADVFWNGEFAQTMLLKSRGVLSPYFSVNRVSIPEQYMDPEGYWTGFGGRARVLIVNSQLVPATENPTSIFDLLKPRWPNQKVGIAYPLFGTTGTHAAALYAQLGPVDARAFFEMLRARDVRVLPGNSVVRDLVVSGELLIGITDTDDACSAVARGAPLRIVIPDQEPGGLGTLIVPNTVALVANGPNPETAKQLIDYLLSDEVAHALLESGWTQTPIRAISAQTPCPLPAHIKAMTVNLSEVYEQLERVKGELTEIFVR